MNTNILMRQWRMLILMFTMNTTATSTGLMIRRASLTRIFTNTGHSGIPIPMYRTCIMAIVMADHCISPVAFFAVDLDFFALSHQISDVGLHCSRPAYPRQSPKHCTSPVHRAEGFWRNVLLHKAFLDGGLYRRPPRPATSGLAITARSAAMQPSVVSTPSGDEKCALPRRLQSRFSPPPAANGLHLRWR